MSDSILDKKYCDLTSDQRYSVELALGHVKTIGGLQVSFIPQLEWISLYIESSVFEFFDMVNARGNDSDELLETCRIRSKLWDGLEDKTRTVREMIKELKGIKFQTNGEVVDSIHEQQQQEITELKAFLLEELRTESEFEILDCCVCREPTFRKLACRHRVCLRCLTKIEKCPLCRAALKIYIRDPVWI
jgi:hypothetical protein